MSEPGVGDRPYVDGSASTPEELRAEVARQADPQARRLDEVRGELATTVHELRGRLDVRTRVAQRWSWVRPVLIATAALLATAALWRRRRPHRDPGT
jgi:hypothetical protein